MQTLTDALRWRYAVQTFDTSKKIPDDVLHRILEAGNLAATSYGLQPFTMIAIRDQATKDGLLAATRNQTHATQNDTLVVLAVSTDLSEAYVQEYIERMARIRGVESATLEGFARSMNNAFARMTQEQKIAWAGKQAYIALGTMMAAASLEAVDNHGLEGFDADEYDRILGLSARNLHATVLLALGYRAEGDTWQHLAKVRRDFEDIVDMR